MTVDVEESGDIADPTSVCSQSSVTEGTPDSPSTADSLENAKCCQRPAPVRQLGQFNTRKVYSVKGAADLMGRIQSYRLGSGDVLELTAGTYNVAIRLIQNDLILRAAPNADVILCSDKASAIEINADCLRLENLTIVGNGNVPAVVIQKGSAEIIGCCITGQGGGILVNRGDPTITNCKVHDCRRAPGIHFLSACGRVENCEIYGNCDAGIAVEKQGANPWIGNCKILNGRGCGIACLDHSRGVIRDCLVSENACAGIFVQDSAHPSVLRCEIVRNKAAGISVESKGRGRYEGCTFEGNRDHEISITTGGNPQIRQNHFRDGKSSGILVTDHGLGVIESNTFTNYQVAAISIFSGADPVVCENVIQFGKDCNASDTCAILVRDHGKGQIRKNHLQGWSLDTALPKEEVKVSLRTEPIATPCKKGGLASPKNASKVPISVQHGAQPQILGNNLEDFSS